MILTGKTCITLVLPILISFCSCRCQWTRSLGTFSESSSSLRNL